jgi:hypothetical protein
MAGSRSPRPIAGNSRDGRLYTTGTPNRYEGERRTVGGRFERRTFSGKRERCMAEWHEWRDESLQEANIHVETRRRQRAEARPETKEETMPATKAEKKGTDRKMYVLTFRGQRTCKDVALFEGEEAAFRMAEALEVALDATSTEGGYEVSELPIWE